MDLSRARCEGADVRVWSGGAGPPLLYLHGFEHHPGDAAFLARLSASRRVCAPEHPGYGSSTGLEAFHGIVDLALYYRSFIEAWTDGPVDLVGHCLGGMFAAEVAALSPHLVRRLVLVNAYGLWHDEIPLPDPFGVTGNAFQALKWHDRAWAGKEPSALDAQTDAEARTAMRAVNLAAATKFMWPLPEHGLVRRLGHIKAPTLILHGASDRLVPAAYARALAQGLAKGRLLEIADAGHLPMIEREDAFVAAVEEFLGS